MNVLCPGNCTNIQQPNIYRINQTGEAIYQFSFETDTVHLNGYRVKEILVVKFHTNI
jgi:hypothetical protein